MSSEWMKVMLDEIARKKAETEQDNAEFERRRGEQSANVGEPVTGGPPPTRTALSRPDDSA